MTPWYVKVFWWTLGIWALGHLVFSMDGGPEPGAPNPVPYTAQDAYEEALQPDNLCPTGPC